MPTPSAPALALVLGAVLAPLGPADAPVVPDLAASPARPSAAAASPPGPGRSVPSVGPASRPGARWAWPLPARGPALRAFRAPATSWGRGHRGVDLAAVPGAPVRAVEGGVVTHAGRLAGRGTVTVTHEDGLRSTYEPVTPSVPTGAVVAPRDVLGVVEGGGAHCGPRTCLHLGAVREGYLDPWPLLVGGRPRLLPLGAG